MTATVRTTPATRSARTCRAGCTSAGRRSRSGTSTGPETARTFADGGAYTGDMALRTADGRLRHVARSDDMLLLGGYKIAPAEIEQVLRRVPDVADCAVVGDTDDAGLARATAYVVPRDGADPAAVRKAARAVLRELAPYKRPSTVEVRDALPTTANGKLARFRLRGDGS